MSDCEPLGIQLRNPLTGSPGAPGKSPEWDGTRQEDRYYVHVALDTPVGGRETGDPSLTRHTVRSIIDYTFLC